MDTAAELTKWNDPSVGSGGNGALAAGGGVRRRLSRKQKAAVMVRLLLAEGVPLDLSSLPESLQAEMTRQIGEMNYVDRATLKVVIDEFVEELDQIGLSFPGGIEGALAILDGKISSSTASRLRRQAGLSLHGDPWPRLGELEVEKLIPVFERESVAICAVLLSKLKVSTAAEILGRLPGPRARRITFAVSKTTAIRPPTVQKIGISLIEQLEAQPVLAFTDGPVKRVGAILNSSQSMTRDDLLAGLEEADKAFADEVRKAIFTFANIPERIDPRDVSRILKSVDQPVLVTALAAANEKHPDVFEFVLGALSQRLAQQIREDVEAAGAVKDRPGEDAMAVFVANIREMEEAGELTFVVDEE